MNREGEGGGGWKLYELKPKWYETTKRVKGQINQIQLDILDE